MPSRQLTRPLATVALLCLGQAVAEPVYKSIDANGNVTYSSTPTPDAGDERIEEIEVAPGPSGSEQRAAEQRLQEIERDAQRQDSSVSSAQPQSGGTAQAEQELARAKANLEQAKVQRDDDWQWLASGGRVLSERYFNRVAEAEAEVRAAEDALRGTRRGR